MINLDRIESLYDEASVSMRLEAKLIEQIPSMIREIRRLRSGEDPPNKDSDRLDWIEWTGLLDSSDCLDIHTDEDRWLSLRERIDIAMRNYYDNE